MNLSPACEFPDLLECLIDGTASREQLFSLSGLLQSNPALRQQARTHLMIAEALAVMTRDEEPCRDPWGAPPGGADLLTWVISKPGEGQ